MLVAPLLRAAPRSILRPALLLRATHTSTPLSSSSSETSSSSTSGKRPSIESTTFADKSAPREVYFRPEAQRGMPAEGLRPTWAKGGQGQGALAAGTGGGGSAVRAERIVAREGDPEGERFAGPSRPRAIYERPGDRELPRIGVSLSCVISKLKAGCERRDMGFIDVTADMWQKRWPWRA